MTVAELRAFLELFPDETEVVLDAEDFDTGRSAVDALGTLNMEDRGDGVKLYLRGERASS